jgi:hypothetical protein
VDPRAAEWRSRILARVDALAARGFHGLFLDTLDSYAMVLRADARRAAAVAMASLIRDISDHHRDVKLLFNRGFELLDDVGGRASAVAAESLLYGWDAAAKRYVDVPAADRAWLTDKLHHVEQHFGIPVIVIDYLPESRREDARAAARRIQAMGFVPWIATPALDTLGVGTIQSHAARILLLYDGAEPHSPIIDLIAERLQALGCAVDYLDVRRGLPREPNGHRAGIVSWFSDDDLPEVLGYGRWLARQIDAGSRGNVRPAGVPGAKAYARQAGPAGRRRQLRARRARGPARRPDRRRAGPCAAASSCAGTPRAARTALRGPTRSSLDGARAASGLSALRLVLRGRLRGRTGRDGERRRALVRRATRPRASRSSGGCSRASSPGSSATRGGAGFTSARPVPATRPSASIPRAGARPSRPRPGASRPTARKPGCSTHIDESTRRHTHDRRRSSAQR